MILSISYQFKIFLISLVIGFILGIFYDFIKIFRKYILHNIIFINIEDTIYWLFMSIIIFLISLYQNNGEIRIFFILGIFLGMAIYSTLISPLFIKIFTRIVNFFIKLFLFIFKAISMPILIVFNIVLKPLKFFYYILKNIPKKLLKKFGFCATIYSKIKSIKFCLKNLKTKGDNIHNDKFKG